MWRKFEQRVELVELAKSMEHLRAILADLPAPPVPVGHEVAARPTLSADGIPEHSVIVGIMGGFDHRATVISTTDPGGAGHSRDRRGHHGRRGGNGAMPRGETPRDAQVRLKAERKAQRRIAKGK